MLASLIVLSGRSEQTGDVPTWAMEVYPLAMAMAIAGYGFLLGHRTSRTAAGLILAAWLVVVGCRGYGLLRRVVTGLDFIAIGLVFFSLAVLTSMAKGGRVAKEVAGITKRRSPTLGNDGRPPQGAANPASDLVSTPGGRVDWFVAPCVTRQRHGRQAQV